MHGMQAQHPSPRAHPSKDGGYDRGQPCRGKLLLPLVAAVKGNALCILPNADLPAQAGGTNRWASMAQP